ncbi:homoaconitase/3-isopropylmalate dehydratase large subunit [Bradyrhizobium sp. GM5.1]
MQSDPGAKYAETIELDCSKLTPIVAKPGDPGNGVPLSSIVVRPKVDIAYGGSCTAGKREDFDHYHAVLSWAVSHGLRVQADVTLFLQFGTTDVRDYCAAKGYLEAFEQAGAEILQPSCGACINCGPGTSAAADSGDHQCDQSQLSWPIWTRASMACQPSNGRCERDSWRNRLL